MKMNFPLDVLLQKFDLVNALVFRNDHNESNHLRYHNNRHMDQVLEDCIEWYVSSMLEETTPDYELAKAVFHAAIFHDVNHSGGALPDDRNIENALAVWCMYVEQRNGFNNNEYFTSLVEYFICATEYPYLDIREGASANMLLGAGVLRDADRMTIYHSVKQSAVDLYVELNAAKPMKYAEYAEANLTFLKSIVWNTRWAAAKEQRNDFSAYIKKVDAAQNDKLLMQDLLLGPAILLKDVLNGYPEKKLAPIEFETPTHGVYVLTEVPEQRPDTIGMYFYAGAIVDDAGICTITSEMLIEYIRENFGFDSSCMGARYPVIPGQYNYQYIPQTTRDQLYTLGINVLRPFPGMGVVMDGNVVCGSMQIGLPEVVACDFISRCLLKIRKVIAHVYELEAKKALFSDQMLNVFDRLNQSRLVAAAINYKFHDNGESVAFDLNFGFRTAFSFSVDIGCELSDSEPIFEILRALYGNDRYSTSGCGDV